jgi:hypothetical protein
VKIMEISFIVASITKIKIWTYITMPTLCHDGDTTTTVTFEYHMPTSCWVEHLKVTKLSRC